MIVWEAVRKSLGPSTRLTLFKIEVCEPRLTSGLHPDMSDVLPLQLMTRGHLQGCVIDSQLSVNSQGDTSLYYCFKWVTNSKANPEHRLVAAAIYLRLPVLTTECSAEVRRCSVPR
jgi:hypothetical protein